MRRILLAVVLLAAACSKRQPNVLLVTFDTTRADRLGFVTGRAGVTPSLDALAQSGTVYTTAIASHPLTGPSHATILTGLQPFHHGVRNNGAYVLDGQHISIAETLHKAGYATHAIVSAYVLDSRFGFDQGFDVYDDDLRGAREIDARTVAEKALSWLRTRKQEQPFFLWLHFYDPHASYTPPADIARTFANDPYSGEIHYADRELGRVLDELRASKALNDTLIVFTADHGESLGEHGELGHGLFVYDATTRVPLLFSGPGVAKGKRIEAVASHVDVVPTILDVLELPAQHGDGASLFADPASRRAYSETFAGRMNFGWSELRSMRSATTRVVHAPRPEVYDLAHDRAQRRNLYGPELPRDARPMFAALERIASSDDFDRTASSSVDEETRRKLAALGYIVSTTPRPNAAPADPKDRAGVWTAYGRAQDLLRLHRFDDAAAELRKLEAGEPASNAIATLLTQALVQANRRDEALDVLKKAIEREPANVSFVIARAELLRDTNQLGEAELLLREAARLHPQSSPIAAALGDILNRASKSGEALRLLEDAHRRDPKSHAVAYNLGVLYERTKQLPRALEMYELAIALDPQHSMSWNNLGSVLDRSGQRTHAIEAVAKARSLDRENVEAVFNLGSLLLESGRVREAIPLLAEAVQRRPSLLNARLRLAAAFERGGDTQRALAVWRSIVEEQPRAWVKVAALELRLGNRDAAQIALQQGIERVGAPMREIARRDPSLRTLLPE